MMKKKLLSVLSLGILISSASNNLIANEDFRHVPSLKIETLQKEINYLRDNQEIRNLVSNLTLPVDDSDAAAFKANFVKGGIFQLVQDKNGKPDTITYVNTDEMEDFLNARFVIFKKQDEQRRHLLTNVYILSQDSTQADVTVTAILLTTVKHRKIKLVSPLKYVLKLEKENNFWKFKHVTGYLDTSLDAMNKD